MHHQRFTYLLATLLLMLLVVPFLKALGGLARFVFALLFFNMILSAVYAVSERRSFAVITGVLAGIVVLIRVISLTLGEDHSWWLGIRLSGLVLEKICLLSVVILVVKHVLVARRVTVDVICASLCAYLLLGVIWAQAYILLTALSPSDPPFSPSLVPENDAGSSLLGVVDSTYVAAVYHSFVTLTTLGYGDITPKSEAARMLCIVEAIVGQFYLAVLVARLVGLHIAGSGEDPRD